MRVFTARLAPGGRVWRWTACLASAVLVLCSAGIAQAQALPDPLPYSKGFLVTGNYVVGGVDLTPSLNPPAPNGFSTGTLNISGVPAGADVVAAFLYWEQIFTPVSGQSATAGVEFRGTQISPTAIKASSFVLTGNPATCWGAAGSSGAIVAEFRADVLYLLPKQFDVNNTWTGKYLVNGPHTVTLPELSGNHAVQAAGATLVIVYRDPSQPLRKVVFYDGAYSAADGATVTQHLQGFYKSAAGALAQVTYIAGTGGNNHGDLAAVNGTVISPSDPFPQTSPSSDRSWGNPTYPNVSLSGDTWDNTFGETAITTLSANPTPLECRSIAAMILSTPVADVDGDGLPDGLEDTATGLSDPPTLASPGGTPLPNLHAMGASSSHQDLFIEINAMYASAGTSYGAVGAPYNSSTTTLTDTVGHNHMPTPDVLKMIGDVYAAHGITPHFDVGDPTAYHNLGPAYACIPASPACNADPYLVPTGLARGGERIQERACSAADGSAVNCEFPAFPGTVGWKVGLQLYRDAPVADDGSELTVAQINATWKTGMRRRRFDRNRTDYFHYVMYAHAQGRPKSPLPCLGPNGPTAFGPDGTCAPLSDNSDYHVPLSVSGVADLPGGNVLITLGLWENFTGTTFVQASTTFHELGHNLNLWHGGVPAIWGDQAAGTATYIEPNCKPNYQSSMNYLFQVHGLFDSAGVLHFDYSGQAENNLDETFVQDGVLAPLPTYMPAWFAPATSKLAQSLGVSAATRFCNGPSFSSNPALVPAPLARVFDLPNTTTAIDWNGDGVLNSAANQNVNFDGTSDGVGIITTPLKGFNDWANIRLDQIGGARTEVLIANDFLGGGSGDFLDFGSGDFLDIGSGDFIDFGSGDFIDIGSGDFLDFGSGDFIDIGSGDFIDIGSGDFMDLGSGDFLDIGSGDFIDFGSGDFIDIGSGSQSQEVDFDKARAIGRAPAFGLQGCVINAPGCATVPSTDPTAGHVFLQWSPPPFGQVAQYLIFRKDDSSNKPFTQVGTSATTSFVDLTQTIQGKTYDYYVKTEFSDVTPHAVSGRSNIVTIPIPKG